MLLDVRVLTVEENPQRTSVSHLQIQNRENKEEPWEVLELGNQQDQSASACTQTPTLMHSVCVCVIFFLALSLEGPEAMIL